jgi:Tfp pilus assembly PilM family ATPase
MEVLLVVAKRTRSESHQCDPFRRRSADVVDIDISRKTLLRRITTVDRRDEACSILSLLVEHQHYQGGMPLFIRDVSVGGNQYTDILKELQLSYQEAEDLKLGKTNSNSAGIGSTVAGSVRTCW